MEKAIKASDIAHDDELSKFNAGTADIDAAIHAWCKADSNNRSVIMILCERQGEPDEDDTSNVFCNGAVHGNYVQLAKAAIAVMADKSEGNAPGAILRAAAKFYVDNALSSAEADDTPTEADTAETTTDNEQADNNNQA
jgi:hypothetical protein